VSTEHKGSIQNYTNRWPKIQISQQIKIALQHKIKFGKSVLKAKNHSWRRNNIIGKQTEISHINNTITKNGLSFWNSVTFGQLQAIASSNTTYGRAFEKNVRINANQIIEHFIAHYQITLNSPVV